MTLASILLFFKQLLYRANLRDCLEILFLSVIIYRFLRWLSIDKQKNLVGYFYFYAITLFAAYYTHFFLLSSLLLYGMPFVFMLFVLLHQEQLQKNFVMLKKVKLDEDSSWFNEFTSACLSALNSNKELVCLIEKHDQLIDFISVKYTIYADFKKDLFDIMLEKHAASSDLMIWVNHVGKLVAINASWKYTTHEEWISQEARSLHKWKQDGIFITSKTDAIVFKIVPFTRTLDIIFKGRLLEHLEPEQAFDLLHRALLIDKANLQKQYAPTKAAKKSFDNAEI